MTKPLEERIAERLRHAEPSHRGTHRAAFLALKDEIAEALAAGWSVKDVWRTLFEEGRIAVGYPAFCDYVNRWIRNSARVPLPSPQGGPEPVRPRTASTGFTLVVQPNKEDLI